MKASKEEIDKKSAELNEIGKKINEHFSKQSPSKSEQRHIQEIRKMLEEGYYSKPPLDWKLGSNGRQGDVLAWRAARYLKGELTDLNDRPESSEQKSNAIVFSNFQEAKEWALKNQGKTITRSSDGTGFVVKNNKKT